MTQSIKISPTKSPPATWPPMISPSITSLRLIRCSIFVGPDPDESPSGDASVHEEIYALEMSWVHSIQRPDRLRHDPQTPSRASIRKGFIEAGVQIPIGWIPGPEGEIPVFGLANLLERPIPATEGVTSASNQRVIVLQPPKGADRPWALLVDRVSQVTQIPGESLTCLPPIAIHPQKTYYQGVIRTDQGLILLLSLDLIYPLEAPSLILNRPRVANWPEIETTTWQAAGIPQAQHRVGHDSGSDSGQQKHTPPGNHGFGRLVVFSTASRQLEGHNITFGLSISQVPEILEMLPMIPVPMAPTYLLGLTNWRNHPVPVIDLNALLEIEPDSRSPENLGGNPETRLIIAYSAGLGAPANQEGNSLVGIVAHSAIHMLQFPLQHQRYRKPLPQQSLTLGIAEIESANNLYDKTSDILIIPNLQRILALGNASADGDNHRPS